MCLWQSSRDVGCPQGVLALNPQPRSLCETVMRTVVMAMAVNSGCQRLSARVVRRVESLGTNRLVRGWRADGSEADRSVAEKSAVAITVPLPRWGRSVGSTMLWSSLAVQSSRHRQTSAEALCLNDFWNRGPRLYATGGYSWPSSGLRLEDGRAALMCVREQQLLSCQLAGLKTSGTTSRWQAWVTSTRPLRASDTPPSPMSCGETANGRGLRLGQPWG